MPRLPRLNPVGIPQHIIQRGNNRQACFFNDDDIACYAHRLIEYSEKYGVDIHAWVFMTNHVHLLATPRKENAISKMMQSLGRYYVLYINKTYGRSGTLWEGRFKSCLVQTENYLLECYRYIELNPVRAGMVADPADYLWSSYQSNALGKVSKLRTPHEIYLALGSSEEVRLKNYRHLFNVEIPSEKQKDLITCLNKGLVYGNERFKDEIELALKRRVRTEKTGPKPREFLL